MSGQPGSLSQASRSTAMVTAWHQARLTVQDFDGRWPRPVSLLVRTPSSTRAWARWRASSSWMERPSGVGDEAAVLVAVQLEQGGLFAGGQLGAAYDDAHGAGPLGADQPLTQ